MASARSRRPSAVLALNSSLAARRFRSWGRHRAPPRSQLFDEGFVFAMAQVDLEQPKPRTGNLFRPWRIFTHLLFGAEQDLVKRSRRLPQVAAGELPFARVELRTPTRPRVATRILCAHPSERISERQDQRACDA